MKGLMLLLALTFASPCMANGDVAENAAKEIAAAAADSRLVVLGEMHGTREIPALVAVLAEEYSRHEPLVLALEMPRTEHQALARYLASDGTAASRDALRHRTYWNIADGNNDGRRSVDMLDLIEAMRALRAAGHDVAIAPYDLPPRAYIGKDDRERRMAGYIRDAYASLARGRMLVLTGNVHASLQPRVLPGITTTLEPMAYHLRDLQPYSIKIGASTGEIWGCRAGHACGSNAYSVAGRSGPWRAAHGHYHYQVVLPTFSLARLTGGDSRKEH